MTMSSGELLGSAFSSCIIIQIACPVNPCHKHLSYVRVMNITHESYLAFGWRKPVINYSKHNTSKGADNHVH